MAATSSISTSTIDNVAMNTSDDSPSSSGAAAAAAAAEKRGEKRHAHDAHTAVSSTIPSTTSTTENKVIEVKEPIEKKAKKKKKKDPSTAAGAGTIDEEKAKAKGYAKSQRANKLAQGIPDQPEGLEIFNLVRPVSIPAALEFYKSIGSPKWVVAPMVNQSELAFRLLTRRYGATLCYTPMMHAKLFAKSDKYRLEQFQTTPADRPLFAQFCANDPGALLEAARHLEGKCDAVDINFGCPQGIARRGNYGSFLLNRPNILRALVTILHNYLNLPVTVKVRILPNIDDTIKMVKMLEACGARLITIHGRTKEQLKDKTGPNDFQVIARLKKELSIPVFSNGGIENYEDLDKVLKVTGANGIMTSEAILGNPAIFAGPEIIDPLRISREYLALAREHPTDSSAVRAHLIKFLFRELAIHTDIRQQLAEHKDPLNCEALLAEIERRNAAIAPAEHEAQIAKIPTWYRRFNPLPGQIRTRDFDKEGGLKDEKKGDGTSPPPGVPAAVTQLQRDRAAKKALKRQKKKEAATARTERLAARQGLTPKQYEQNIRQQKHARKDAQRRAQEAQKLMAAATAALQAAVSTGTVTTSTPTTDSTPTTTVPTVAATTAV